MHTNTDPAQATTVWATVVTRDRLNILQDCIQALRAQTRPPNVILVIDNDSSDGTENWLRTQKDIQVIRQANTGSAGGQYRAFKTAYEGGADWIWTMDDDVYPAKNALEELLLASTRDLKITLLASKVIASDGTSMNVPGIDMSALKNQYASWERLLEYGMVAIEESTFVSILVSRSAIERAGYPLEALFIWGDDTEFSRRCTQQGPSYLVGTSIVEHRRVSSEPLSIWRESDPNRINTFYYLYRNHAFIAKRLGQTISRRNQKITLGPLSYCILLGVVSLKDALKNRRIRPLITIIRGTVQGLIANYKVCSPGATSTTRDAD